MAETTPGNKITECVRKLEEKRNELQMSDPVKATQVNELIKKVQTSLLSPEEALHLVENI